MLSLSFVFYAFEASSVSITYYLVAVFVFVLQEEMEEGTQSIIYDDYKFLTKKDLERLNLTSLIGTNLLRACMHGFFIDNRLYKKVMLHLTFKNMHYFISH